ncbi:MAG: ABC transporter ATP-binding protein [Spirochaetia bacterium]|nr:ABC transporter ATP-binding protein [Spirochaetia bacterium]
MSKTVLEVKDLSVKFRTEDGVFDAVEHINFSLDEQKTLAIVGESGSGKSVTSLAIMQLLAENGHISNGEIFIDGVDILKLSQPVVQHTILGKKISMIFQEPMTALNPILKIGDQITECIIEHQKTNKKEAYEIALETLKLVGIPTPERRINQFPHELSGGMRQRVMIAMALVTQPKIMIADEPTTALDVTIEAQILNLLEELKKSFKTSILFVTHDLNVVADIADDVIVMYCGQIIEKGPVIDIFETPHHPYTKGLLLTMPTLEDHDSRILPTIRGVVPSITRRPSGCYFHPRCASKMDICVNQSPPVYKVGNSEVKCFLYSDEVQHEKR